MTLYQFIGAAMLALFLVWAFRYSARVIGWRDTALIWGGGLLTAAWIVGAVYLLVLGTK